jgi:hypothetical protein
MCSGKRQYHQFPHCGMPAIRASEFRQLNRGREHEAELKRYVRNADAGNWKSRAGSRDRTPALGSIVHAEGFDGVTERLRMILEWAQCIFVGWSLVHIMCIRFAASWGSTRRRESHSPGLVEDLMVLVYMKSRGDVGIARRVFEIRRGKRFVIVGE